jgi:ATP-dependent helicase/nuclease subunit A
VVAPPLSVPGDAAELSREVDAAWSRAAAAAASPRAAPTSVTARAHAPVTDPEAEDAAPRPERRSRYGPAFGEAVHRAVGLALADAALEPAAAVARAAAAAGLDHHLAEAAADVARALAALEREGLRRPPGPDLRLEYPVARLEGSALVGGYVDLLAVTDGRAAVVDFKTDAPPEGDVAASHAAYVEQVRAYARVVEALGLAGGGVRAGLLFTAEGAVRWVA